jgi:hypothetical protein
MCAFDQCIAGTNTNNNFDCDAFSAYAVACLNQNRFIDGWANVAGCMGPAPQPGDFRLLVWIINWI